MMSDDNKSQELNESELDNVAGGAHDRREVPEDEQNDRDRERAEEQRAEDEAAGIDPSDR